MTKIKCRKCELKFRDREDKEDSEYTKMCCWNCRFIITCITATLTALASYTTFNGKPLGRAIILEWDDLKIRKSQNND